MGASRVIICSDKREFIGPIVLIDGSLGGIGDGREIEGEGEVEWCFRAANGSYVAVILPAGILRSRSKIPPVESTNSL